MGKVLPISLCMIVKDEEFFLDAALKSVRAMSCVGEMIVADTGSTDRTVDIAMENGAVVYHFEWCDDFSAARNFAADKAENDWILVLDADEEVIRADIDELALFITNLDIVGAVSKVEMTDKSTGPLSRLYNKTTYRYEGIIHEQIVPNGDHRKIIKDAPIHIIHHGYAPEFKQAKGKLERNERLLLKELATKPDDSYLLYQLGKCYFDSSRDLPRACEVFEKALSSAPDVRLEYVYSLVECYGYALINVGEYEKALDLMQRYSLHYKKKPHFRFLSAHILQNNGMFIEAVEQYESCIGANIVDYSGITSYLSFYNIGVVLECVGMVEDAVAMYNRCDDYAPAMERLKQLTS